MAILGRITGKFSDSRTCDPCGGQQNNIHNVILGDDEDEKLLEAKPRSLKQQIDFFINPVNPLLKAKDRLWH